MKYIQSYNEYKDILNENVSEGDYIKGISGQFKDVIVLVDKVHDDKLDVAYFDEHGDEQVTTVPMSDFVEGGKIKKTKRVTGRKNFIFRVDFESDMENLKEGEKKIAKEWRRKDVKIQSVKGTVTFDRNELTIKLSDDTTIVFISKESMERYESDVAHITIISHDVRKSVNVSEYFFDYISCGSIILSIMRIYEEIKDGKI